MNSSEENEPTSTESVKVLDLLGALEQKHQAEKSALQEQHQQELRRAARRCQEEIEVALTTFGKESMAQALALEEKKIRHHYGRQLQMIADMSEKRLQLIAASAKDSHDHRVRLLSDALRRIRDISRNFDVSGSEGVLALREKLAASELFRGQAQETARASGQLAAVRRSFELGQPFSTAVSELSGGSFKDAQPVQILAEASHKGVSSPTQLVTGLLRRHSFESLRQQLASAESLDRGDVCSFLHHLKQAGSIPSDLISPQWVNSASYSCRVLQAIDELELTIHSTQPEPTTTSSTSSSSSSSSSTTTTTTTTTIDTSSI